MVIRITFCCYFHSISLHKPIEQESNQQTLNFKIIHTRFKICKLLFFFVKDELLCGTGNNEWYDEMLAFCHETQHEEIIDELAIDIAIMHEGYE